MNVPLVIFKNTPELLLVDKMFMIISWMGILLSVWKGWLFQERKHVNLKVNMSMAVRPLSCLLMYVISALNTYYCVIPVWLLTMFFFVARVGLMHIGVFILLLLSGERNFGVRLNKPYSVRVPMDIPVFTGTHADFLIIVSVIVLCPIMNMAGAYTVCHVCLQACPSITLCV